MALFKRDQTPGLVVGGPETVLGASTNFQGVLKSDGNIRVDGILQGRIETAGNVVIGPSARVVADIRANALQVWGHLQGNVHTNGRLEILSTGRLFGEVTVGSLMIDEGGLFRGQCFMDGQDVDELALLEECRLLTPGGSDNKPEGEDAASDADDDDPAPAEGESLAGDSAGR